MVSKTTLNKKYIFQKLREHTSDIRAYEVSRLGLFGSVVRNEANNDSDLDLLVEFNKGKKNYNNFIHLAFLLEDIFKKKVDLLTWKSLSDRLTNDIKKEIEYVTFHS